MLDIGGNIIALVLVHCKIAYICVYIITGYQKVDMSIDSCGPVLSSLCGIGQNHPDTILFYCGGG